MKNDQNRTWKVYIHTTPDGWVYVGVTGQDLTLRWIPSHYKGTALEPYIQTFGWDNIKHEVIYTTTDRDEAYKVEEEMRQYYEESGCCINKYRSGLVKAKDNTTYQRLLMRQLRAKKKAEKLLQSGQIEMPLAS